MNLQTHSNNPPPWQHHMHRNPQKNQRKIHTKHTSTEQANQLTPNKQTPPKFDQNTTQTLTPNDQSKPHQTNNPNSSHNHQSTENSNHNHHWPKLRSVLAPKSTIARITGESCERREFQRVLESWERSELQRVGEKVCVWEREREREREREKKLILFGFRNSWTAGCKYRYLLFTGSKIFRIYILGWSTFLSS